jgi:anaerobic magnesium-protoporphyrin IX monomethyl ester cyclase
MTIQTSIRKKLLLIYPNQRWEKNDITTTWNLSPAVLCLLASMVKDIVDIKVIDAQFYDLSVDEFKKQVKEYAPNYAGISVLTSEYENTLKVTADAIKEVASNTLVIAGGVHVTIEYKRVMENINIDYAVRGEGEYVLKSLISYLNGDANAFPKEGLVYRKGGKLIEQAQAFVQDLTKLPWSDYSLVNMHDYVNTGARNGPLRAPEYPSLRLVVTRGCPVGCSFCQVEFLSGKNVRTRDPEDIIEEILFLKQKYGIKSIIFEDDNISMPRKFFLRLLKLFIERDLKIKFIIQAFAVFTLTDEMLDLMVRAGCQGVNIAIESGSQRVLREIVQKPVQLATLPERINKITDRGLFVLANFIVGYPGETWDEIQETVRYAEHCGADYVKLFVAVPLKGTKMWDMAVHMGVLDKTEDDISVDWRYGQISSDEWTSKDISILRAYEWDRINFSTPERRKRVAQIWGLSEDEMTKIRKRTRDSLTFDANLVSNASPSLLLNNRKENKQQGNRIIAT